METSFLFEVIFITVYLNEWFENTVDQIQCKVRPSGEISDGSIALLGSKVWVVRCCWWETMSSVSIYWK